MTRTTTRTILTLAITALTTTLTARADLDLRLTGVSPVPIRAFAGNSAQTFFGVEKVGTAIASDVQLTIEVPVAVSGARATVSAGTCSAGSPIVCAIPDRQSSLLANVTLSFNAPNTAGPQSFHATVSSSQPDPNPVDNQAAIVFDVITDPDLNVTFEPFYNPLVRIEPGKEGTVSLSAENWSPESAHDVHVRITPPAGTVILEAGGDGVTCVVAASETDCTLGDFINGGGRRFTLHYVADPDRNGGKTSMLATISSRESDFNPGNNSAALTVDRYRLFSVSNTNDAGPGSLRQAITDANLNCDPIICKIVFELARPVPDSGFYTIAPEHALPLITAHHLVIDGTSQTALTGDTNPLGPEVELSGRSTADGSDGFSFMSACDAQILSLAVNDFITGYGVVFNDVATGFACSQQDQRLIDHSYLGTDATGREARPNMRGMSMRGRSSASITKSVLSGNVRSGAWGESGTLDISDSLIGVAADGVSALPNGRSGLYFAPAAAGATVTNNKIAHNFEMGVAVARGATYVDVHTNSIFANGGLGIDHGLDGVDPLVADDSKRNGNAPTIASARWDATTNSTIITGSVVTGPLGPYANAIYLELFGNDSADSSGFGEGQTFIGSLYAIPSGAFSATLKGDYRGKWITATSTRVHFIAKTGSEALFGGNAATSEFSNAVKVSVE
jgi:hypothetical protein